MYNRSSKKKDYLSTDESEDYKMRKRLVESDEGEEVKTEYRSCKREPFHSYEAEFRGVGKKKDKGDRREKV